jgi:hypothetical protein
MNINFYHISCSLHVIISIFLKKSLNTFTATYLKIWPGLNSRFFKAVCQFLHPYLYKNMQYVLQINTWNFQHAFSRFSG